MHVVAVTNGNLACQMTASSLIVLRPDLHMIQLGMPRDIAIPIAIATGQGPVHDINAIHRAPYPNNNVVRPPGP